jgi:hypothetical protein
MGMDPEYEFITKSIQGLAENLVSVGDGASKDAMTELLALFSKIETASAQAARELEEKLRSLAPALAPANRFFVS